MHWPFLHALPVLQSRSVEHPGVQVPDLQRVSRGQSWLAVHCWHLLLTHLPLVPHWLSAVHWTHVLVVVLQAGVGALQSLSAEHPVGVAAHAVAPSAQVWPAGQSVPVPQARQPWASAVQVWSLPPEQRVWLAVHALLQVETQRLFWQACPAGQALFAVHSTHFLVAESQTGVGA